MTLSHRLVGLHAAKPRRDAGCLNDVLYMPRQTPVEWEFDRRHEWLWLSLWEPERCLGVKPLGMPGDPNVKIRFTLTNDEQRTYWEPV